MVTTRCAVVAISINISETDLDMTLESEHGGVAKPAAVAAWAEKVGVYGRREPGGAMLPRRRRKYALGRTRHLRNARAARILRYRAAPRTLLRAHALISGKRKRSVPAEEIS